MIPRTTFFCLLFIGLLVPGSLQPGTVAAAEFDHTHALFDKVLQNHVRDALVSYRALKSNSTHLNHYLDTLAAVKEPEFNQWTRSQQLAFLINLYNASTLKLIIDHYPVASIKKIGNIFKGPWDQPVVRLFGKVTDLDALENKVLRKKYDEPRIHFALVCAALGCPPLRSEAYTADKLDEQLDDQGRIFLAQKKKNWVDVKEHKVYLSPIFKWYDDDFEEKSGSVLNFVTPYFPEAVQRDLRHDRFRVRYSDYDWSLNDAERQRK